MTNDGTIIEWAPFRLAPGVSEEQLLQVSEAVQRSFMESRPGFLRRELLRGEGGQYVDVIAWRDREAADDAMKAVEGSAECQAYFRLMVLDATDPGAGVLHFARAASYG